MPLQTLISFTRHHGLVPEAPRVSGLQDKSVQMEKCKVQPRNPAAARGWKKAGVAGEVRKNTDPRSSSQVHAPVAPLAPPPQSCWPGRDVHVEGPGQASLFQLSGRWGGTDVSISHTVHSGAAGACTRGGLAPRICSPLSSGAFRLRLSGGSQRPERGCEA